MSDVYNFFNQVCPFCLEFERGYLELNGKRFERQQICETEHFVVFPALGAFIPGWLLIAPKEHHLNMAVLPESWSTELNNLVRRVQTVLRSEYGPTITFEHGPASWNARGGCCVEHAHMQIVSTPVELTDDLLNAFHSEQIQDHSDLSARWNHQSYLYYENQSAEKFLFHLPDIIPSQYMRQLIARKIDRPDEWNWRQHHFLDELEETKARLGPHFSLSL